MKILIACECSGIVRRAFRERGHDAWSCDIKPSEDKSEFHKQSDVLQELNGGGYYDMLIAFPPCTHLASSGAAWFEQKRKDGRQQDGINFFLAFTKTKIRRVAIENPVGIMSKIYKAPTQIIQPYYFGDEFQKTTCLWLINLPPLAHASEDDFFMKKTHVGRGEFKSYADGTVRTAWFNQTKGEDASTYRSRLFPGIANAMAEQ